MRQSWKPNTKPTQFELIFAVAVVDPFPLLETVFDVLQLARTNFILHLLFNSFYPPMTWLLVWLWPFLEYLLFCLQSTYPRLCTVCYASLNFWDPQRCPLLGNWLITGWFSLLNWLYCIELWILSNI